MKLSKIILAERAKAINERLNVARDRLYQLRHDIGTEAFADTILRLADENILDDLVDAMNFSEKDGTSYYNPDLVDETKELNEGDVIKIMGDVILPIDKQMILQAEEDEYNRGLLVTNNKDKSYDIAYWANEFKPYPIEVEIDGKSVAKEAKVIKLLFHPEMNENKKK